MGTEKPKEYTSFEAYMKACFPRKWKAIVEGCPSQGEDCGEDDE